MAQDTIEVEDASGNKVQVPVGVDGKNPVSPNNPLAKQLDEAGQEAQKEFMGSLGEDDPAQHISYDRPTEPNTMPPQRDQRVSNVDDEKQRDEVTRNDQPAQDEQQPSGNASQEEWEAYARKQDEWDEDDAGAGRDTLREKYGK